MAIFDIFRRNRIQDIEQISFDEGVDSKLIQLIENGKIDTAKELFQDRDDDVLEAIAEYDPNSHPVMFRSDKYKGNKLIYRTEKLPRAWQKYINLVASHFLLAKPISYTLENPDDELTDAFNEFANFIIDNRHHDAFRELKRLAGSETEAALLYHLLNSNGNADIRIQVISKSKGYTLRPLFDQYERMIAFAYGYYTKQDNVNIEHFDILMPEFTYRCIKRNRWTISKIPNPTGKINAIYALQEKEWAGTEQRIARDEMLDCKNADTNNRFADPKAIMTTDVIQSLTKTSTDGQSQQPIDIIQVSPGGKFEYVSPPDASESKRDEKENLKNSILQDSLTPDITFSDLSGSTKISGEAMRRAMILGYIKRDIRKETYGSLVTRDINIILSIMANVTHIQMRNQLLKLKIEGDFAEPFDDDENSKWTAIGTAYQDGIISLETAINLMGVANAQEEINKIQAGKQSQAESSFLPIGIE